MTSLPAGTDAVAKVELPARLRAPRARWLTEHPLRTGGLMLGAVVVIGSIADPAPALAGGILGTGVGPNIGPNVVGAVGSVLDPVKWIVKAFVGLLNFVLGNALASLAKDFINALLAMPNLVSDPQFAGLAQFHDYIQWAGWGLLTLSFTAAALIYWSASYTSSGAAQAAGAFTRTIGAIGLLLCFPTLFGAAITAVNLCTAAIIQAPVVGGNLTGLIDVTLTASLASGGGLGLVFGVVALVLAIILLIVKVTVTALLAILYCLSPLAIGLWPVEQLSWLLRTLTQVMFAVLVFPVIWAVSFGVFACINHPSLLGSGFAAGVGHVLFDPLLGVAALTIAFKLPFATLRMATGAGLIPSAGKALSGVFHAHGVAGLIGP